MKQTRAIIVLYVLSAAALLTAFALRLAAAPRPYLSALYAAFGALSLLATALLIGQLRIRRRKRSFDL